MEFSKFSKYLKVISPKNTLQPPGLNRIFTFMSAEAGNLSQDKNCSSPDCLNNFCPLCILAPVTVAMLIPSPMNKMTFLGNLVLDTAWEMDSPRMSAYLCKASWMSLNPNFFQ